MFKYELDYFPCHTIPELSMYLRRSPFSISLALVVRLRPITKINPTISRKTFTDYDMVILASV